MDGNDRITCRAALAATAVFGLALAACASSTSTAPPGAAPGAPSDPNGWDINVTGGTYGFGPGDRTGSVRRITFTGGEPNPPQTMATTLSFPDGVGLWPRA